MRKGSLAFECEFYGATVTLAMSVHALISSVAGENNAQGRRSDNHRVVSSLFTMAERVSEVYFFGTSWVVPRESMPPPVEE